MAILMVRHSETDWNVKKKVQGKADIPLNENGMEQAKIVRTKLKDEKIDFIICSPLKRARQTAEIINKEIQCPISYKEGISERDFGEFEGKQRNQFDFEGFWSYEKDLKFDGIPDMENLSSLGLDNCEVAKYDAIERKI